MELINKNKNSEIEMEYGGMKCFNNNDNLIRVLNTETRVYAATLSIFGGGVL